MENFNVPFPVRSRYGCVIKLINMVMIMITNRLLKKIFFLLKAKSSSLGAYNNYLIPMTKNIIILHELAIWRKTVLYMKIIKKRFVQ